MRNLTILWALSLAVSFTFSCKEEKKEPDQADELITISKDSIETEQPQAPEVDSIQIPEGYTKLADVMGNLDQDEELERVIVYETHEEGEMGTKREIRVYKLSYDGQWSLWHISNRAVLSSRHGGMMGDPFADLRIERKCIVIEHSGGSREKWMYTHRYRRQNKQWTLIGASVRYGAPCDFWDEYDYNLSTGKIAVKKLVEDCDNELNNKIEEYAITHKLPELPLMESFYPGNNELKTEHEEATFYY